mmetsp:Transcript_42908/g.84298  ORF Transcript_42908/g.84298 Transcript_42908/m.84298 type:complete len:223 (-) Transcript_42908:445-1113(-)
MLCCPGLVVPDAFKKSGCIDPVPPHLLPIPSGHILPPDVPLLDPFGELLPVPLAGVQVVIIGRTVVIRVVGIGTVITTVAHHHAPHFHLHESLVLNQRENVIAVVVDGGEMVLVAPRCNFSEPEAVDGVQRVHGPTPFWNLATIVERHDAQQPWILPRGLYERRVVNRLGEGNVVLHHPQILGVDMQHLHGPFQVVGETPAVPRHEDRDVLSGKVGIQRRQI